MCFLVVLSFLLMTNSFAWVFHSLFPPSVSQALAALFSMRLCFFVCTVALWAASSVSDHWIPKATMAFGVQCNSFLLSISMICNFLSFERILVTGNYSVKQFQFCNWRLLCTSFSLHARQTFCTQAEHVKILFSLQCDRTSNIKLPYPSKIFFF